jgi:hypothetical protein
LLSSAPEPLRKPAGARVRARIALLRGDKAGALQLLQESTACHQEVGASDDAAREQYALGCLSGGEQGEALKRDALSSLSSCGVANPDADLRAYYPELFRAAAR